MKSLIVKNQLSAQEQQFNRRNFLKKGILLGTFPAVGSAGLVNGFEEEEEVTPTEDLMREHGLLNRILLIYDHCRMQLENKKDFPLETLNQSAQIIRNFIEEYHEKLEENYLFPRFEKANRLTDLVKTLRTQHQAGRDVTEQIIQLAKRSSLTDSDVAQKLIHLLAVFNSMYRPHEAREDTVLFPALRKIVSENEYDSLGEDFEKKEHEKFGDDGFDMIVDKVAALEKKLGIYELSKFTPKV